MVRTRYAPSPTGHVHIGNIRSALYEYLIAKYYDGQFILRIEDTDTGRFVEGATDIIYNTLKIVGIKHDEGPDIGGPFGPYVQSARKPIYMEYAKQLVEKGEAYYCFCTKERLEQLHSENPDAGGYDNHCRNLPKDEAQKNLAEGKSFVIRQRIPEGTTSFDDIVYGTITIENETLDDQVLIKSDGFPTYNFANVVDDHLMEITHVVRGSEYLSSTPKYNLLYKAFGWEIPQYVHLPLIVNTNGEKLSKRKGDKSFDDLLADGFLAEAVVNFIALLGWSPGDNREFFTLSELEKAFDPKGISKSPSALDIAKLTWMNGEYFKKMDSEKFYEMALPVLKRSVKKSDANYEKLSEMAKTRINFLHDINELFDFIDELPKYSKELYVHKKMKTDETVALDSLKKALPLIENFSGTWENDTLYAKITDIVAEFEIKNSQLLWPLRTALSGKPSSPGGASELMEILGKEESLRRIKAGIELLEK